MRSRIGLLAMLLALTPGTRARGYDHIQRLPQRSGERRASLVRSRFAAVRGRLGGRADVAIYQLNLPVGGNTTFDSNGFAGGGADPYFTLFSGLGPSATFLYSNYDQAFSTGGDFLYVLPPTAGDYTVAMGVFANMSYAENLGAGALGDGFIGLGSPDLLGSYYYELGVTRPDEPVPRSPSPPRCCSSGRGWPAVSARGRNARSCRCSSSVRQVDASPSIERRGRPVRAQAQPPASAASLARAWTRPIGFAQ
ncbi:MAG: DVUA0089 family protein [Candidatus Moduliflexus flocculans]|nr:DVUA0089 family protein [Candidatus Moduliflexus flocculans]